MPPAPPELPTKSQGPVTIPQLFEALCSRDQEHEMRYARVELDVLEIKRLIIEEFQVIKADQRALRADIDRLRADVSALSLASMTAQKQTT